MSNEMKAGWGGLRTPQPPEPVQAPSTTIYDDRFDEDRESGTATLTVQRDHAEREGDTESVRLYNELLERRRRQRGRTPLINEMPEASQRALDHRVDELEAEVAGMGRRPAATLREQVHTLAWMLAEEDDLSDYPHAVTLVVLH